MDLLSKAVDRLDDQRLVLYLHDMAQFQVKKKTEVTEPMSALDHGAASPGQYNRVQDLVQSPARIRPGDGRFLLKISPSIMPK